MLNKRRKLDQICGTYQLLLFAAWFVRLLFSFCNVSYLFEFMFFTQNVSKKSILAFGGWLGTLLSIEMQEGGGTK